MPSATRRSAVVSIPSFAPAIGLIAAAALPSIASAAVSFTPLTTLGGTQSNSSGLSASGGAGTGGSTLSGGTFRAFYWTPGGGMSAIPTIAGMTFGNGTAISADGTTVTGISGNGSSTYSFRWTSGGGTTNIGQLPGADQMYAQGISGNGNVIVGNADQTFGWQRAYRWQNGSGFTDLGFMPGGTYARATGITADASKIVGFGDTTGSGGDPRAFSWTSGGGYTNLGTLPGGTDSYALNVSDDGVPVGYARNSLFQFHPVVYSGGTVTDLGMLAGFTSGSADDASLGAASVVGSISGGGGQAAFLWTSALGMVNLNTFLPSLGIDLTGWQLQHATSISEDGLTIMGYGTHAGSGFTLEAWVAVIPSPSVATSGLALIAVVAARRRRTR